MTMKLTCNYKLSIALLFVAVLLCGQNSVHASNGTIDSKGLTIDPAMFSVVIRAQDTEKSTPITITNNEPTALQLIAEARSVDDKGAILAPTKSLDPALTSVIQLDKHTFTLDSKASTQITLTVKNKDSLPPGGTYLALVVYPATNNSINVSLRAAVSSSIFIIKEDGAQRSMSLQAVDIPKVAFMGYGQPKLTFKNTGNVHIVPRGTILTMDSTRKQMFAKGIVNSESMTLMPGRTLTFAIPMQKISESLLPKRLTYFVQYRFDGSDDIQTKVVKSIYLPIALVMALCFIVLFLLAITYFIYKNRKRRKFSKKHDLTISNETKVADKLINNSVGKKIAIHDAADGDKITVKRG